MPTTEAIITFVVTIISLLSYIVARRYQKKTKLLKFNRMKIRLLEKIDDLQTLQMQARLIYSNNSLRDLYRQNSDTDNDYEKMEEDYFDEIERIEQNRLDLLSADGLKIDISLLIGFERELDIGIGEYRNLFNSLPPEALNLLLGKK